jgi:hypothetical protein
MPHDLFVQNLERFGKEVLPALQAHVVTTVPSIYQHLKEGSDFAVSIQPLAREDTKGKRKD